MLSFLPFIGPILQGVVTPIISLFSKFSDNKLEVLKTETQGSVEIIKATKDDWGIRLARDILIWPWAAWMGAYGWDTLVAENHRQWMIHVASVPQDVSYIPYAVMVFLLGNIGLNMWKRNG